MAYNSSNFMDDAQGFGLASKNWTKIEIQGYLDGLDWQESVLSFIEEALAVETTGNRYIASAAGATWTKDNIYEYTGSAWKKLIANKGFATFVEDLIQTYVYTGVAWTILGAGGATDKLTESTHSTTFTLTSGGIGQALTGSLGDLKVAPGGVGSTLYLGAAAIPGPTTLQWVDAQGYNAGTNIVDASVNRAATDNKKAMFITKSDVFTTEDTGGTWTNVTGLIPGAVALTGCVAIEDKMYVCGVGVDYTKSVWRSKFGAPLWEVLTTPDLSGESPTRTAWPTCIDGYLDGVSGLAAIWVGTDTNAIVEWCLDANAPAPGLVWDYVTGDANVSVTDVAVATERGDPFTLTGVGYTGDQYALGYLRFSIDGAVWDAPIALPVVGLGAMENTCLDVWSDTGANVVGFSNNVGKIGIGVAVGSWAISVEAMLDPGGLFTSSDTLNTFKFFTGDGNLTSLMGGVNAAGESLVLKCVYAGPAPADWTLSAFDEPDTNTEVSVIDTNVWEEGWIGSQIGGEAWTLQFLASTAGPGVLAQDTVALGDFRAININADLGEPNTIGEGLMTTFKGDGSALTGLPGGDTDKLTEAVHSSNFTLTSSGMEQTLMADQPLTIFSPGDMYISDAFAGSTLTFAGWAGIDFNGIDASNIGTLTAVTLEGDGSALTGITAATSKLTSTVTDTSTLDLTYDNSGSHQYLDGSVGDLTVRPFSTKLVLGTPALDATGWRVPTNFDLYTNAKGYTDCTAGGTISALVFGGDSAYVSINEGATWGEVSYPSGGVEFKSIAYSQFVAGGGPEYLITFDPVTGEIYNCDTGTVPPLVFAGGSSFVTGCSDVLWTKIRANYNSTSLTAFWIAIGNNTNLLENHAVTIGKQTAVGMPFSQVDVNTQAGIPVPDLVMQVCDIQVNGATTRFYVGRKDTLAGTVGMQYSEDVGNTWTGCGAFPAGPGEFRDLYCVDGTDIVYVLLSDDSVVRSTDKGATWGAAVMLGITQATAISGSADNNIYVGGVSGVVKHSTDSGASWTTLTIPGFETSHVSCMAMVSDEIGIAGSDNSGTDTGKIIQLDSWGAVDAVYTQTYGLVIPNGTTPAPDAEGSLYLDSSAGANGTLKIYSNAGWRTVQVL